MFVAVIIIIIIIIIIVVVVQTDMLITLLQMKHPNIVSFDEAFRAGQFVCIVMEFCEVGVSLDSVIIAILFIMGE